MASFNVSVSGNTLTISEGDVSLKNVNMPILGGSGGTTQWNNDIFFSVYQRFGGATYFYSAYNLPAIGVGANDLNAHDIGMVLATLFPNLYNNPNANTIQTDYPEFGPSFARLNGTDINTSPSYALTANFNDDAYTVGGTTDVTNTVPWIFTQFGIGDKGFASTISNNLAGSPSYAICLTGNNPVGTLTDKQTSFCDAVPSGALNVFVVYTNIFTNAFSNGQMIHPYQFLAIWPVLARISINTNTGKNPIAFLNTLFDTFWMKRGTSTYFDRTARRDTTYGCFGNYLLSVFNFNTAGGASAWNIPVIPAFSAVPEYAIIKYIVNNFTPGGTQSATLSGIGTLWNAGYSGSGFTKTLIGNVDSNGLAKVYRRLMMFYCAAIERGNAEASGYGTTFISNTETQILATNPEYATVADFYQAGANALTPGEYAYFFKYAKGIPLGGSNVFDTYVSPYLSWAADVNSLPVASYPVNKAFVEADRLFQFSTILSPAIYSIITTTKGISYMSGAEANDFITYVYPPA
jgi:hypothetical protein